MPLRRFQGPICPSKSSERVRLPASQGVAGRRLAETGTTRIRIELKQRKISATEGAHLLNLLAAAEAELAKVDRFRALRRGHSVFGSPSAAELSAPDWTNDSELKRTSRWSGIGHVAVGMHRRGFLQLT